MVIAPIKIRKRLRNTQERFAARRVQTNDRHMVASRNDCENTHPLALAVTFYV